MILRNYCIETIRVKVEVFEDAETGDPIRSITHSLAETGYPILSGSTHNMSPSGLELERELTPEE